MAKKFKKINFNKCQKDYKRMLHEICFNLTVTMGCSKAGERCEAYKNWTESDGRY
jgi:hypothetical protein